MDKLYEILIRFHPDGRIGAHVQFYQADGVTPAFVQAINMTDFPGPVRQTVEQLLGAANAQLLEGEAISKRERDEAARDRDIAIAELDRLRRLPIVGSLVRNVENARG